LARAKNTQRSAARRRYRQEVRPNTLVDDAYLDDDDPAEDRAVAAAEPIAPPARSGIAGMFSRPDFRGDFRTFPSMLLSNRRLWIPFALLLVGFAIVASYVWGSLPADSYNIAALAFTLILSPQALFVPFIGGFLAPRAAYLVGALIGVFDSLLIAILVLGPFATDARVQLLQPASSAGDLIGIFIVGILFATFAAAFASWYRRFLRQSQERAKVNRAMRDQQMAAKRKDDERKARVAERDARRAASTKKSTP
jgi:hypothetical protein